MPGMKPEHRAMPIGRGTSAPVPVHDPDHSIADSKMPMLVQALDPAYMTRALREQVEASGRNSHQVLLHSQHHAIPEPVDSEPK